MINTWNIVIALQFVWPLQFGLALEVPFHDSLLHGESQDVSHLNVAKHLISALLAEGETCTLADGKTHGTCRRDIDCLSLMIVPQDNWKTCSFDEISAIVCCPELEPHTLHDTSDRFKRISDDICAGFSDMPVTENHILNGTAAQAEDFPYLGALLLQDARDVLNESWYGCGASLISDRFMLTAAHCLVGKKVVHVRLGALSLEDVKGEEPVIIGIEETFIHPNYTKVKRKAIPRNDIALLKLSRKVVEDFLIPACLYTEPFDPLPDKPLAIAGWGGNDTDDGEMSSILLKAQVPIYERNKCDFDLRNAPKGPTRLYDDHLCTLGKSDGEVMNDTCVGDSGGPLELSVGRRKYIVGITSTGKICGTNFPGIYTRVSHFIDWIVSIVWLRKGIN